MGRHLCLLYLQLARTRCVPLHYISQYWTSAVPRLACGSGGAFRCYGASRPASSLFSSLEGFCPGWSLRRALHVRFSLCSSRALCLRAERLLPALQVALLADRYLGGRAQLCQPRYDFKAGEHTAHHHGNPFPPPAGYDQVHLVYILCCRVVLLVCGIDWRRIECWFHCAGQPSVAAACFSFLCLHRNLPGFPCVCVRTMHTRYLYTCSS